MKTNTDVKKVATRAYRRPPGGIGEATKSISVGLYLSLTHNTMFVKKTKRKRFKKVRFNSHRIKCYAVMAEIGFNNTCMTACEKDNSRVAHKFMLCTCNARYGSHPVRHLGSIRPEKRTAGLNKVSRSYMRLAS